VVIDGPDSVTADALGAIQDERVRFIALPKNVGGSEARNIGVRNARGGWIAFLDDDDEWLPSKVERQLFAVETKAHDPDCCVVVSQFFYVREKTGQVVFHGGVQRDGEPVSEYLLSSRGGYQSSVYFVARSLVLQCPFRTGLKKHQDWDWLLRVGARPGFELIVVKEALSKYWLYSRMSQVSKNMDWRFSVEWATSMRGLLTRKAYSMFLVKTCLRSAKKQSAGLKELLQLIYRIVFVGKASASILAKSLLILALPEPAIDWISDNAARWFSSKTLCNGQTFSK